MGSTVPLTQHHADVLLSAEAAAPDPDFDRRWDAWVARGRVHERRVRRLFIAWASILAAAAAVVYLWLTLG
jgi:hypothetical protein